MSITGGRFFQLVRLAVLIALAWAFLGFFFASQQLIVSIARDAPEDVHALVMETILFAILWALLTPPIIGFAERLPVARPRAARNAAAMFVVALAFAALRGALDAAVPFVFEQRAFDRGRFFDLMASAFHVDFIYVLAIAAVVNYIEIRRGTEEQRRREAQAEASLADARLRRLRADLQPHFLFNTLNGIAALARMDGAAAAAAIAKLADLLERSAGAEQTHIRLSEELDFVRQYLDLQRLRFGPRLHTRIEVDDPAVLSASIPPLLLQPLVENSIVHGIRVRAEGGTVTVRASRVDGELRFEVRDTGPGCDPSTPFVNGHVGVTNTVARLDALYGSAPRLHYHRDGGEFVAELRVPLQAALQP